jgi:hypothetical protein
MYENGQGIHWNIFGNVMSNAKAAYTASIEVKTVAKLVIIIATIKCSG